MTRKIICKTSIQMHFFPKYFQSMVAKSREVSNMGSQENKAILLVAKTVEFIHSIILSTQKYQVPTKC
jgi:hypothetical protein